jgi:hypothetical protein
MANREHWKNEPDDLDSPTARDYLSLVFPDGTSAALDEHADVPCPMADVPPD